MKKKTLTERVAELEAEVAALKAAAAVPHYIYVYPQPYSPNTYPNTWWWNTTGGNYDNTFTWNIGGPEA